MKRALLTSMAGLFFGGCAASLPAPETPVTAFQSALPADGEIFASSAGEVTDDDAAQRGSALPGSDRPRTTLGSVAGSQRSIVEDEDECLPGVYVSGLTGARPERLSSGQCRETGGADEFAKAQQGQFTAERGSRMNLMNGRVMLRRTWSAVDWRDLQR